MATIKEEFLQLGWKTGLFVSLYATLVDGKEIEIVDRGQLNYQSGPDFSQAKIRIDNTLWVGNIEMHVKSSDWFKHKHSADNAYNSVILHVVWEHDAEVLNKDGTPIPTLELKPLVSSTQLHNYLALLESLHDIPCQNHLKFVDSLTIHQMIHRAVVNRIERKSDRIKYILADSNNDWDQAFYQLLFRNFGFKTNQHAFEALISELPYKLFDTLKDKPLDTEALLFGVAGLLHANEHNDPYVEQLIANFEFLKHKHKLQIIAPNLWKFGKLRPHNFPYIRLAQLASLLTRNNRLFSRVLAAESVNDLIGLFSSAISPYWVNHYKPGVQGNFKNSDLSKDAIDLIIINTCVPVVFMYGRESGNLEFCDKALQWLEAVKPENNAVIKYWKSIGISPHNCFESQGLMELREVFCTQKKCLNCAIGFSILANPKRISL